MDDEDPFVDEPATVYDCDPEERDDEDHPKEAAEVYVDSNDEPAIVYDCDPEEGDNEDQPKEAVKDIKTDVPELSAELSDNGNTIDADVVLPAGDEMLAADIEDNEEERPVVVRDRKGKGKRRLDDSDGGSTHSTTSTAKGPKASAKRKSKARQDRKKAVVPSRNGDDGSAPSASTTQTQTKTTPKTKTKTTKATQQPSRESLRLADRRRQTTPAPNPQREQSVLAGHSGTSARAPNSDAGIDQLSATANAGINQTSLTATTNAATPKTTEQTANTTNQSDAASDAQPKQSKKKRAERSPSAVSEAVPVGAVVGKVQVCWLDIILVTIFFSDGFLECVDECGSEPEVMKNEIYANIVGYVKEVNRGRRRNNYPLAQLMLKAGVIDNIPPKDMFIALKSLIRYLDDVVSKHVGSRPFASLYDTAVQRSHFCIVCDKITAVITANESHLVWQVALPKTGEIEFDNDEGRLSTEMLYRLSLFNIDPYLWCGNCQYQGTMERFVSGMRHGSNLIMVLRDGETDPAVKSLVISKTFLDATRKIRWHLKTVIYFYNPQLDSDSGHVCAIVTNGRGERYYVEGNTVERVNGFNPTDVPPIRAHDPAYPVAFLYIATDEPGSTTAV